MGGQEKAAREPALLPHEDPDLLKGAIEGDRPDEPQQGNPNAGALDENGMPADEKRIVEDVVGANEDQSTG